MCPLPLRERPPQLLRYISKNFSWPNRGRELGRNSQRSLGEWLLAVDSLGARVPPVGSMPAETPPMHPSGAVSLNATAFTRYFQRSGTLSQALLLDLELTNRPN
jgi:hypothetical protein